MPAFHASTEKTGETVRMYRRNLKAEERAPNSPKQSGYSVKNHEKSGQNFTP